MLRKVCASSHAAVLGTILVIMAFGHYGVLDNNHLRIFTPYHSVRNVFNVYGDNDKSIEQVSNDTAAEASSFKRQFTQDEIDLIAGVVYAESKGEPFKGKVGVASVILNRLQHPNFPKSVEGVIYEKNAFSCIYDGSIDEQPDIEAYEAVMEAINGNDPTKDAVFFYNPRIASSKWMKKVIKNETIIIGSHIFFK